MTETDGQSEQPGQHSRFASGHSQLSVHENRKINYIFKIKIGQKSALELNIIILESMRF